MLYQYFMQPDYQYLQYVPTKKKLAAYLVVVLQRVYIYIYLIYLLVYI